MRIRIFDGIKIVKSFRGLLLGLINNTGTSDTESALTIAITDM